MYRGKVALDVAEAQHLMEGLDWPGAVKDIQASVKWLKANGSPKVGLIFVLVSLFSHVFCTTEIISPSTIQIFSDAMTYLPN